MEQPDGIPGGPGGGRTVDPARLRATARRWGLFGAGMVAAFVAIAVYSAMTQGPPPLTTRDVQEGVQEALASMTPAPARSQLVYAAIRPSLVLVQVTVPGTPAGSSATPGTAPDGSPSTDPVADGLGSGVVVSQQGDILTSLHVVKDATSIRVTFADGTESPAEISSSDPANDIAVLTADTLPATVVPAPLGNPRAVQIGNEAYVVGNPFGLYGSLSAGVVSGLDRSIQPRGDGPVLHGLIQVDAAVNPGNSGGPLLNRDGQVVGIVAALLNPTSEDVFVGIGLAVPIDVAGGAAGLPRY
jgi:S1-C subfamily serine protease